MDENLLWVKEHWNQTADSDWYRSLRTEERILALRQNPSVAFHPDVFALLQKYLPDLRGKKVLLPSSGDNHAAFAFALMGAAVTSADISEKQLENAQQIARQLGLTIRFVCEDTMHLSQIEDACFDLVYTSNGTHTWIDQLDAMYQNIHRVLKTGGFSIMYDVHPFQRPFTGEAYQQPTICKAYSDTLPSCHWRVQDLVNAQVCAGLAIRKLAELPAVDASFWFTYDQLAKLDPETLRDINQWQRNPLAALPVWISIVSQKA